jgi:hypothetical protein
VAMQKAISSNLRTWECWVIRVATDTWVDANKSWAIQSRRMSHECFCDSIYCNWPNPSWANLAGRWSSTLICTSFGRADSHNGKFPWLLLKAISWPQIHSNDFDCDLDFHCKCNFNLDVDWLWHLYSLWLWLKPSLGIRVEDSGFRIIWAFLSSLTF